MPEEGSTGTWNEALNLVRRRFGGRGEFVLRPGESINEVVARERVPHGYGVYLILSGRGPGTDVVYIGKAGTVRQDGTLKDQGIGKRLTMKQGGVYRKKFFAGILSEGGFDCLHFEWFVTFGGELRVPPFLVEAELLAAYLESYGRLPIHNVCA